ncbi:MAG TPA: hypothetical protein VFI23_11900 [Rhizomicrobium sp.]|nr:hypothetical protein [Rhizomicrobium sp.]
MLQGRNIYSQRGDDGIIAEIFRRLDISQGFFVEFGGWDGVFLANSRALFEAGWGGAFIEANLNKFADLKRNYAGQEQIICINEWVALPGHHGKTIDQITAESFPARDIDFMTIDIDGLDYRILETMVMRPKVVCVEGGFAWNPEFTERVPDDIASRNLQQPLSVMIAVGRAAGYEPVCFNQNLYLVLSHLAEPFADIRNDAMTLWQDAWFNESDAFRTGLIKFRARNRDIRRVEGENYSVLPIAI